MKRAFLGGRRVALPQVRFVRHRTPMSLLRAYFKPMGVKPEELEGVPEHVADMRREGAWAFAATRASPPTIHWWASARVDPLWLAMLLGHEVGHLSGRRYRTRRNQEKEELRADTYGAAAYLALQQVLGRGRR